MQESTLEDRDLAFVGFLRTSQAATNDGEDVNGPESDSWDENPLGGDGEVGRGYRKTVWFDGEEIIGKYTVEDGSVAEAHADPEAAGFGAAGKRPVVEIGKIFVEILNKTKDFNLLVGEGEDIAVAA